MNDCLILQACKFDTPNWPPQFQLMAVKDGFIRLVLDFNAVNYQILHPVVGWAQPIKIDKDAIEYDRVQTLPTTMCSRAEYRLQRKEDGCFGPLYMGTFSTDNHPEVFVNGQWFGPREFETRGYCAIHIVGEIPRGMNPDLGHWWRQQENKAKFAAAAAVLD